MPSNVITIDSNPRGLKVFEGQNQLIGRTPFFKKISPARNQVFSFLVDSRSHKFAHVTYRCNFNWNQSIFPSLLALPLFPLGTLISVSSLGIDLYTGGLYNCKEPLFWDTNKKSSLRSIRKKILVIPILDQDEIASDEIFFKWKKNVFDKNIKGRDEFLDYEKIKKELNTIGINNLGGEGLFRFKRGDLNFLGEKFKFTHVLNFKIEKKGRRVIYTPELYDVFSLQKIERPQEEKNAYRSLVLKKKIKKDLWFDIFIDMVNLLPNTFLASYSNVSEVKSDDTQYNPNLGYSEKLFLHPKALPRYVKALGFFNVNHPDYFKPWDVSLGIYPTFSMSSWRIETTYLNKSFAYDMYTINAFYDFQLSFQTPFGSPNLSIGFGLVDILGNTDNHGKFHRLTTATKIDMDYIVFFSQSYFFKLGIVSFFPYSKAFMYDFYHLKSWMEITLSLGYYYPELKSLVRSIFKKGKSI